MSSNPRISIDVKEVKLAEKQLTNSDRIETLLKLQLQSQLSEAKHLSFIRVDSQLFWYLKKQQGVGLLDSILQTYLSRYFVDSLHRRELSQDLFDRRPSRGLTPSASPSARWQINLVGALKTKSLCIVQLHRKFN